MRLETIDLGLEIGERERERAEHAVLAALDQYMDGIQLIRIRLAADGHHGRVRCKMRAWCGPGPTLIASAAQPTFTEAIDAAADKLQRAVRRRKGRGAVSNAAVSQHRTSEQR